MFSQTIKQLAKRIVLEWTHLNPLGYLVAINSFLLNQLLYTYHGFYYGMSVATCYLTNLQLGDSVAPECGHVCSY